ncbi:MAG TPA: CGNR zinc finger domain-containing protein [Pseudonocardiaceae bacterium]|nr:CGNR zinc finger domain-containing protein [Pseudonocardiaceae bacterium]
MREFAECDPTRVKACARQECGHFFYDTTRNRSTLWHAEVPCGWRMRSARRAATQGSSA